MLDRIDIKYFKLAVGMDSIGKETDVDIVARCPVCGDSQANKRKKRLHLYIKNGVTNVNCFNGDCAAKNKTVYSFLRDFFPALISNYKREQFGNTVEKLASGNGAVFGNLKKKEEPVKEHPVQVHDLTPYMKPLDECQDGINYIKGRHLDPDKCQQKYGRWYYGYQDLQIGETVYRITNSVIIPLYYNNQMYGFYSRSTQKKDFVTYMNDQNIGYKIWNWFNIDKNKPVFIYEAIFDAISGGLPNSIALMGAKLPEERLKELKYPIFVLDTDTTGIKNSIEYAKMGHRVFVPPKHSYKDMNENLKNGFDCPRMIIDNLHTGISAEIRLKSLL